MSKKHKARHKGKKRDLEKPVEEVQAAEPAKLTTKEYTAALSRPLGWQ